MQITSFNREVSGRRYRLIKWEGLDVRVYDDARTALLLIELFDDKDADAAVRFEIACDLLFVDPLSVAERVDDVTGLVGEAMKQIAGFSDKARSDKPVLDWSADARYIRASVQMAYAQGFDELSRKIDFEELCSMVALCPHETPIGQALYYRTAKPPKPTKHNRAEREDFERHRRFWALKPKVNRKANKKVDLYGEMNKQATFAALAIKRARG